MLLRQRLQDSIQDFKWIKRINEGDLENALTLHKSLNTHHRRYSGSEGRGKNWFRNEIVDEWNKGN